jgi:hypothetical protein
LQKALVQTDEHLQEYLELLIVAFIVVKLVQHEYQYAHELSRIKAAFKHGKILTSQI